MKVEGLSDRRAPRAHAKERIRVDSPRPVGEDVCWTSPAGGLGAKLLLLKV